MAMASTSAARDGRLRDFAVMVLAATIIGNSSVLVRLGEMGPATTAFWRMVFALPALALWAWLERPRIAVPQPAAGTGASGSTPAALLAGLCFAADMVLSNMALGLTSIANFIVLVHLAPVFVIIAAWFLFGERPGWSLAAALALAIAGAGLLAGAGGSAGGGQAWLGDLLAVAAAVFYAAFILALRKARLTVGAGEASLVSSFSCAFACLAAAFVLGEKVMPVTAWQWLMVALLGLFCHALGQGLSAHAMGVLGASVTSVVLIYSVLVSVLGGWLVFGETLGIMQAAGAALVLTAVVLSRPPARPVQAP
jgi:drug/metabolite transporter (DMT)-like permease